MDRSAILTYNYLVLFTTCLLSGTPVFGSQDPYIFLLDVGNAGLQKTTLQQTLLSVTGGSMSFRYPASGNGGMITHTNVVGKDYGSDLTAVITSGGPGYQFIELTVIGQDNIPYQLLVTVEGQKSNAEVSDPDNSFSIPDDLKSYGSVPLGSAAYEKNSYINDFPASENTRKALETENAEDLSKTNEQNLKYVEVGVLPSSEIGDEMYPDEPRFKNVEQYTDSYDSSIAYNVDLTEQDDSEDDIPKSDESENRGNSDNYSNVEEVDADSIVEENSDGVGADNGGDSIIEENDYEGDENYNASKMGDSDLSKDIRVSSLAAQSNKDFTNVFTSENARANSYLVSNDPYKFWDMNNADPKINELDSDPQQESYKMDEKKDFTVREKKAPEEYPWDDDELPDPAFYERYKVLKPHLYGDVQMGPHGERQDLNVSPHWTKDIKSDSLADEQYMQTHNGADISREDDDGSYDNDDVSAALY